MRLIVRIAALVIAVGLVTPGVSARQTSPRNASYKLTAALDVATRTLTGHGRLTWRNTASIPATELRFHLYWNAWRDVSSTWFRELQDPMAERARQDPGAINLTGLSLVTSRGTQDLLARLEYIAPDDGNVRDRTVATIKLDEPVRPGGVIDLDMAWTGHLPRTFARTGVLGQYYFIGHWFPKIAVHEETGWNSHQFHAATEFFADFGTYDVTLKVPAGWVVGATGREQSRTDNGDGTATHRYVQDDVHDFAWTTSPLFADATRRLRLPNGRVVDIRMLLQPEHQNQIDRHFDAAERALSRFSEWFGPYPYAQLTIVDPVPIVNAAQGEDTGGMEYPTIITAGTRWSQPWRSFEPEDTVVHEIAHQFWQGVVGNNEFEYAWLDEGLATYVTGRLMTEVYPDRFVAVRRYFGGLVPWAYLDVPSTRDVDEYYLLSYRSAPDWDAPSRPSWQYAPASLGALTYSKTALWLLSLERMFGRDMVQRTLGAFYSRGAFRHPAPDELFTIASSVAGRDLTWFFDAVHRSAASFDYAVDDVTDREEGEEIESRVVVRRLQPGIFPVEVRTTFDDGGSVSERWDGRDPWREFAYRRSARVRTVEIDPTHILTLDLNYTNNSWTAEPRAAEAARHWTVRWMTWFQTVLLTYAFFA